MVNPDQTAPILRVISCLQYRLPEPNMKYSKTCLKRPLKNFQYRLSLNAGKKYCRLLQAEHSAKLSPFIKLPLSIKTFVLSIFKRPLKTGFTVP